MTGTTVFPSCAFACSSVEEEGANSGSADGASDSAGAGGAVAGGGKGDPGDDPGPGVPWGTTMGGKRYIRHQLMPPPGLRSEPATVRRVGVCGSEGGWDDDC